MRFQQLESAAKVLQNNITKQVFSLRTLLIASLHTQNKVFRLFVFFSEFQLSLNMFLFCLLLKALLAARQASMAVLPLHLRLSLQ